MKIFVQSGIQTELGKQNYWILWHYDGPEGNQLAEFVRKSDAGVKAFCQERVVHEIGRQIGRST